MIVWTTASPGEVRAVAAVDGAGGWRIVDIAIERPGRPDGVGDLHRGRAIAHVPALAGFFVALADGSEGFLPGSAAPAGLSAGDAVAVRIVRAAQGGKGPRLGGGAATPPGPPALLARGPGAAARLAARHPAAPVQADGARLLAALRPALAERVSRAPFPPALADALAAMAEPAATLDGGLRASFHPTPALVAIDMDTAGTSADRRGKDAAQFAANRQALPDLARHLRARNLSGAIVVDLAGLTPRRRAALGPALADALAPDPAGARFLGFTALGLAEIVRTRAHPPLHELMAGPHAAALAACRALVREGAARPAAPVALRLAPDVHAALGADPVAMRELAEEVGRPPLLQADPAYRPGTWTIEEATRA